MTEQVDQRRGGTTIRAQVMLLSLAAVAAAQAISFLVIVLTPAPALPRMTVAAVRDAALRPESARRVGLTRRVLPSAPFAANDGSNELIPQALALGLGIAEDRVLVRSLIVRSDKGTSSGRPFVFVTAPSAPEVQITTLGTGPPRASPSFLQALLRSDFGFPAFEAAVRQPDGAWLVIAPSTSIVSDWRFRLSVSLLLGLVAVVPLAGVASRRLTRPLRALASAARVSSLGGRPDYPQGGPPEIAHISQVLGAMHRRLADQYRGRMRMLVAIAHDLRTPLSALRLRIESAPAGAREQQGALIGRMDMMIGEILDYAASFRPEPAASFDLVDHVRRLLPMADERGRSIGFDAPAEVLVELPSGKVGRAVVNLIDNAVRYAESIEVVIRSTGRTATIDVRDRGPGIPEADLTRVLEPFERGEISRNRKTGGMGLGMSIAEALASEMDGRLQIANRADGGLVCTLTLPCRPPPHDHQRATSLLEN